MQQLSASGHLYEREYLYLGYDNISPEKMGHSDWFSCRQDAAGEQKLPPYLVGLILFFFFFGSFGIFHWPGWL